MLSAAIIAVSSIAVAPQYREYRNDGVPVRVFTAEEITASIQGSPNDIRLVALIDYVVLEKYHAFLPFFCTSFLLPYF